MLAISAGWTGTSPAINIGLIAIFNSVRTSWSLRANASDAALTLLTDPGASAAIIGVSLEADALSSAQCQSLTAPASRTASPANTGVIAGTSVSAAPTVSRISSQRSANAGARRAQARVGIALRLHFVFNQQVGIGAQG